MTARDTLPAPLQVPHSIEAEQSLLGALLLENRAWDRVSDVVCDLDFYRDDHRRIFRHIRMAAERAQAFDVLTVFNSLEQSSEAEPAGGLAYLGDLANNTPSAATAHRHAEIVRDRAAARALQTAAIELQRAVTAPGSLPLADIASVAQVAIDEALGRNSRGEEPAALAKSFSEVLEYIDSRGDVSGLQTGFRDFDATIGGLEPGQLVIVAARPSVGKTIFGCNVADHAARSGAAVLLCTLEMTRREISMRMLSARAGVPMHAMRSGTKRPDDWASLTAQLPAVESQRLFIDDWAALSVAQVRTKARHVKRKAGGLDLIVIDYLQLMTGTGANRTQEIGSISRGLKALAKELEVPIVALAQLNRAVEGRTDKRPMLSDLRDSGEVEQDADIVVMLHRESLYSDAHEWLGVAELLVRKNRNGPTGDMLLSYYPEQMRFADHVGANPRRLLAEQRRAGGSKHRGFD